VVCALLKEIIPRYVIPISIGSDNGPAFVAEVLKELTKGLKLLGTFTQHTSLRVQTKLKA
jgi:N-methylhydantoinase A/oxoprolinase/acetone carboxylase beta subunit